MAFWSNLPLLLLSLLYFSIRIIFIINIYSFYNPKKGTIFILEKKALLCRLKALKCNGNYSKMQSHNYVPPQIKTSARHFPTSILDEVVEK